MNISQKRLKVIDSHTGGEPTRVIIAGAPPLQGRTIQEKRDFMRSEIDWVRTSSILEPRGHEAIVGAILCEPSDAECVTGVIFFNNHDYLNGCLHGTMGVAVTLKHLGRINEGKYKIETPAGIVTFSCGTEGRVTVTNAPSWRCQKDVEINVPNFGLIKGDIAWGGNWFFLTEAPKEIDVTANNIEQLTTLAKAIKTAIVKSNITGQSGAEIDHIEIFGKATPSSIADSKNFVLCPGNAYDRSPCGTGTSAKLACLATDGHLQPGQTWRQAGILDTIFEGTVEQNDDGKYIPTVTGSAFVTAEADLIIDPDTPFAFGIPSLIE